MPEEKQQKIAKTKGRPMLHWVGKKPIDVVQGCPAQLIETVHGTETAPMYDVLESNWQNLLFHGDNKEVLSTLIVNGFRGKVDLIYVDPPFDSGADYVRKVELRGNKQKVKGEEHSVLEQTQYTDIWANDNYLQFMYERLILMRELLSNRGAIYLHCDWHKDHMLRMLMDEVFSPDNFVNEITWSYRSGGASKKESLARKHDTILLYRKSSEFEVNTKQERQYLEKSFMGSSQDSQGRWYVDTVLRDVFEGVVATVDGKTIQEYNTRPPLNLSSERTDYPTQKPLGLLDLLLDIASKPGDLVLDCFVGSGTTAVSAEHKGRKWIGADINKGAIQSTMKRLQKNLKTAKVGDKSQGGSGILHFRVNNYDFQKVHELKSIIVEKYDVTPTKTDSYFDGTVGEKLVKIAELNQPVNKLSIQGVLDELTNRPDETRDILVIGSGVELGVDEMLATYNKTHSINKIEVRDVQSDGIIIYDPAEADVSIARKDGKVKVTVNNYLSPTILKRLEIDRSIFGEKISDFRSQIDVLLVDTDYDGKTFNIVFSDVPEKKTDYINGEYEIDIPQGSKKVAVKIIDMLGEETLIVE